MAIFEEIQSTGPRRRLQIKSPVDLAPLYQIDCLTADDVRAALESARKAQQAWGSVSFADRARIVTRACEVLIDRQDEVIDTIIGETGKARTEAIGMEILSSCDAMTYYAKKAEKFLKVRKRRPHGLMGLSKRIEIHQRPLGVVGVITPWNAPFVLAMNQTVQALMAGNAVLLKPSEVTPMSTAWVGRIFEEAGLPEGALQVLLGDGQTGAALCEAGVDKISFTGSVATGKKVGECCGRLLIPCSLELGGKDAMIVCADADIDRAASGALISSCMNTGQYCCATERIYVADEIYQAFVDKVVERAKVLRQGTSGEFDVGAVFWDRQLAIIDDHVEEAKRRGAVVRVGGRRNPDLAGLYYEPTVLTEVDHSMKVMTEETFGPIVAIMRVKDDEEAIERANDSRYGLSGTIYTRDNDRARDIAMRIQTGSVCVNDMTVTYACHEAPFGGLKESGVGQVNGAKGIRGFSHAFPVIFDRKSKGRTQSGYPYSRKREDAMQKLVRLLWKSTPLGRLFS